MLAREGHVVSKSGVALFIKNYSKEGGIGRKPGSSLTGKKTEAVLKLIDSHMEKDDELSLEDFRTALQKEDISVSVSSLHRWRQELGWTTKGTKYCQMVKEVNVEKRLDWAKENCEDINLDNLVFTDETTVQLENHRRVTWYKKGCKPRYKPKPKHPIKLQVRAGISKRGLYFQRTDEHSIVYTNVCKKPSFFLSGMPILTAVNSYRTMTPSTVLDWRVSTMMTQM